MPRRIEKIAYHRNGVTGYPFHVITFTDEDGAAMIGVVFDAPDADNPMPQSNPRVAVFNREQLGAGVVAFGVNSHRGDHYADYLFAAIDRNGEPF